MKLAAIAIVLLLLLGGGGGAYWYTYMRAVPGEGMAEEGVAEAQEPAADPVFVEFNPIQVPVIEGGQVTEQFAIALVLEARSPQDGDQVVLYSPRLNDAFLQVLYGVVLKEKLKNGTLDLSMVKARVLRACNALLGEGVVQDVLVQAIGQQTRSFSKP